MATRKSDMLALEEAADRLVKTLIRVKIEISDLISGTDSLTLNIADEIENQLLELRSAVLEFNDSILQLKRHRDDWEKLDNTMHAINDVIINRFNNLWSNIVYVKEGVQDISYSDIKRIAQILFDQIDALKLILGSGELDKIQEYWRSNSFDVSALRSFKDTNESNTKSSSSGRTSNREPYPAGSQPIPVKGDNQWKTGLYDLAQCKTALLSYKKEKLPENSYRLESSLNKLGDSEIRDLSEWADKQRIKKHLEWHLKNVHNYRYMPAYELMEYLGTATAYNMHLELRNPDIADLYNKIMHWAAVYKILNDGTMVLAHGTKNDKKNTYGMPLRNNHSLSYQWALLNIILEGKVTKGGAGSLSSNSVLTHGPDSLFTRIDPYSAQRFGPFFVIFSKKFAKDVALEKELTCENNRAKDHVIYLVPGEESAKFLRLGIEQAVKVGLMSRKSADLTLRKIMTYKQFVDGLDRIEDILSGKKKPSDIINSSASNLSLLNANVIAKIQSSA